MITSGEQDRRVVPQMLTTSGGCGGERGGSSSSSRNDGHAGEAPSRENLLSRVQELERELRLADIRDARRMGAAVGAEHSRARKNGMDDEVWRMSLVPRYCSSPQIVRDNDLKSFSRESSTNKRFPDTH